MAGVLVAQLDVQIAGSDQNDTQHYLEIRGSEQFYIGRNSDLCRHVWPDPAISNRHLQIHCIIYEPGNLSKTPPFVYATDLSTNGTFIKKHNAGCSSSQGSGIRMGRKNGSFLLDDGDELRLSDSVTLVFRSNIPQHTDDLTPVQRHEKHLFSSNYLITGRVLGEGSYGKVVVAVRQKTQRQAACKIIDLTGKYHGQGTACHPLGGSSMRLTHDESANESRIWPSGVSRCFREFDIIKDLNHPNIISLEKVFWSLRTIYIFQELVTGGDLFSYIDSKKAKLSEVEAAVILRQIIKGVEYLHDRNIVHRDLKPDNILMTSLDEGARIVITDFGAARFLPDDKSMNQIKPAQRQRMFSLTGTLEYTAPEIHKQNRCISAQNGYSKSVDMWSVGTLAALLVTGYNIFNDQHHPKYEKDPKCVILGLASRCDLGPLDDVNNGTWNKVGTRPKEFIKRLLRLREDERMTATEALNHPWLYHPSYADELDALYQRSIRHWQPRRKVFKLVEPISNVATSLESRDIPEDVLSQEAVSRFFGASPMRAPSSSMGAATDSVTIRHNGRDIRSLSPIEEDNQEACYIDQHATRRSIYSSRYNTSSSLPLRQQTFESSDLHVHVNNPASQEGGFSRSGEDGRQPSFDMNDRTHISDNDISPQTPQRSSPYVLVPETPIEGTKRRYRSSVAGSARMHAASQESNDEFDSEIDLNSPQYFEQEPCKRRKLLHVVA